MWNLSRKSFWLKTKYGAGKLHGDPGLGLRQISPVFFYFRRHLGAKVLQGSLTIP